MMMRSIWIAAMALLLSACAPTQVKPTLAFDEFAFRAALGTGMGSIEGQAFLRTMIGEVRYAAGSVVKLYPITPYVTECVRLAAQNNWRQQASCDPRVQSLARQTQADADGRFAFGGVLPGRYYVETSVVWSVPFGTFGSTQEGGYVSATAYVSGAERVSVILTR
jgi:hypothetical protein